LGVGYYLWAINKKLIAGRLIGWKLGSLHKRFL
jgi:hypothetical protein